MNDKEYSVLRAKLFVLRDYWIPQLHLDRWRYEINLVRGDKTNEKDRMVYMDVSAEWEYMHFTISVYTEPFSKGDEDNERLEYSFLHECAHVLLAEMEPHRSNQHYIDHEERVATLLAWSWQRMRPPEALDLSAITR